MENLAVRHGRSYFDQPGGTKRLDTIPSKRALLNLCQTSKRLHGIAEPILYASFARVVKRVTEHRVAANLAVPSPDYLTLMLRTLGDRPDLASKLKTIDIGCWTADLTVTRSLFETTCNSVRMMTLLLKLHTIRESRSVVDYCDGDGAAALLLMSASKNLQELSFMVLSRSPRYVMFIDALSSAISPTVPGNVRFPNLHSITMDFSSPAWTSSDDELDVLPNIFRLRALRRLTLVSWCARKYIHRLSLPQGSSAVNELRMYDCFACHEAPCVSVLKRTIEAMVKCCSSLSTFEFKHSSAMASLARSAHIPDGKTFKALLRHQAQNLQNITIDCPHANLAAFVSTPDPSDSNAHATGWDMRDFSSLKHLRLEPPDILLQCPCERFFGLQNILPASVERLVMLCLAPRLHSCKLSTLHALRAHLPNLQRVEYRYVRVGPEKNTEWDQLAAKLPLNFSDANVELSFTLHDYSERSHAEAERS